MCPSQCVQDIRKLTPILRELPRVTRFTLQEPLEVTGQQEANKDADANQRQRRSKTVWCFLCGSDIGNRADGHWQAFRDRHGRWRGSGDQAA